MTQFIDTSVNKDLVMDRARELYDRALAFVGNLSPFKWAAAAFWIMLLVSIVVIAMAANAVVNTKYSQLYNAITQASHNLKSAYAVSAPAAQSLSSLYTSLHVSRHFLDGQYGVVVLASVVAILSIAGIISSQQVIADVTKDDSEAKSGTTTVDYMWLSSLGSLVFAQGIILFVIAVFMSAQYGSYRKAKHLTGTLKAGKVSFDATMIVQFALGYIGLIGGILFYSAIRVSRS